MRSSERWFRRAFQALRRVARSVPGLRTLRPKTKRRILRVLFGWTTPYLQRRGRPVEVVEGLRLHLPPALVGTYVLQDYEPVTRRLVESFLEPGMVVVDVGANVGLFSILAARRVGPSGKVYAIEPGPDNVAYLSRNLELHGCGWAELVEAAAGAETTERTFYLHPVGTVHSFQPVGDAKPHTVRQVALDDVVTPPVDLVKIDAEGEELGVLAGMGRLVRESPRLHLIVEWSPSRLAAAGQPPEALPRRLRELGFRLTLVRDDALDVDDVDEALEALGAGRLPRSWGANLFAQPTSQTER